MATKQEILNKITESKTGAQDIIRRNYLNELSKYTKNDTIVYAVSYPCQLPNVPGDLLSIGIDDIQGFMTCLNGLSGEKLDLIIHSPGGSMEATEQLVQYLRAKYTYIRAIIPQNAMSAATMLACACDEIVMGKHSAIGPIDPQMTFFRQNGTRITLPAHSILADFETAKKEVLKDNKIAALWVPKLIDIPPGFLDLCQKTIDLSKSKVADWLNKYMFKDEKEKKGDDIAKWLGDFSIHKTHGRPINYQLAEEKGLKISLLENDPKLQDKVLNVFHASMATFEVTTCVKFVENHKGIGKFTVINPNNIQ